MTELEAAGATLRPVRLAPFLEAATLLYDGAFVADLIDSTEKRLTAEGVEMHRTSRTAVYRIEARAQDDRLVATALARVFRTDRPWAEA